jgi:hypothetical protein
MATPIPIPAVDLYSDSGLQEKEPYHTRRSHSSLTDEKDTAPASKDVQVQERNDEDSSSDHSIKEVFDVEAIDPILARKMALINSAIEEIGMTGFQWKMFYLNGFGYAVDSVSWTYAVGNGMVMCIHTDRVVSS